MDSDSEDSNYNFYDEIELEDMEYNEENETYPLNDIKEIFSSLLELLS